MDGESNRIARKRSPLESFSRPCLYAPKFEPSDRPKMDLLEIVKAQVSSLPDGLHQVGLRSVLRHIEAAYRHLSRGEKEGDESAFTDAIYRTNQAFEGSIKEAYRVLAARDPNKVKPYDIESYLETNNVFRPRVLSQFTNYRKEWRNASTHDYNLDFNQDEAFLAIVSVSAFSKMLVGQIVEKLAFEATRDKATADPQVLEINAHMGDSFLDMLTSTLYEFIERYSNSYPESLAYNHDHFLGSIAGYLSVADEDIIVDHELSMNANGRSVQADLLLTKGNDSVILEVKRGAPNAAISGGLQQIQTAALSGKFKSGIILVYNNDAKIYAIDRLYLPDSVVVSIIAPVSDAGS